MTNKNFKKGFTLIETLVAVMILASSIAGPLSIANRALNNSVVARDQIIAFNLAQDGVEFVRYARDTNTLSGNDWIAGTGATSLSTCVGANSSCYLDSTLQVPTTPQTCPSNVCPVINYDGTNMRYTYATAGSGGIVTTLFTRKINLTQVNPASGSPVTEYKLTVTVSWSDVGGVARQVQVVENLYAWI
jgi:prepilin-type N-terminal cleavage/methylation domain-containing protein